MPRSSFAGAALWLAGMLTALAALGNAGLAFQEAWKAKTQADTEERELSKVREHNQRLREKILALRSDPRAVRNARRLLDPEDPVRQR